MQSQPQPSFTAISTHTHTFSYNSTTKKWPEKGCSFSTKSQIPQHSLFSSTNYENPSSQSFYCSRNLGRARSLSTWNFITISSSLLQVQALPSFITIETSSIVEGTAVCVHSSICIVAWGAWKQKKEVAVVVGSASSRPYHRQPLKLKMLTKQRICLIQGMMLMNMDQLMKKLRGSLRDSIKRWECRGRNPYSSVLYSYGSPRQICSFLVPQDWFLFFFLEKLWSWFCILCCCLWICLCKFSIVIFVPFFFNTDCFICFS